MARTNFERLRVYQLSERLADQIWNIVLGWNNLSRDTVGKQVIRSADSIGANIAEGCGRGRYLDNKRFVRMARGSLNETQHWLRRAYKRNLLTKSQVERLTDHRRTRTLVELLSKVNRTRDRQQARDITADRGH